MKYTQADIKRFFESIAPAPQPSTCWHFTKNVKRDGRGYFRIYRGEGKSGKDIRATRAVWEMLRGEIPAGLVVCHACDNPRCVRPDHLFIGTQADNLRDMRIKGRGYGGTSNLTRPENRVKAAESLRKRSEARRG